MVGIWVGQAQTHQAFRGHSQRVARLMRGLVRQSGVSAVLSRD